MELQGGDVDTVVKGLCIATRCTSVAEFIEKFHPLCDETSLFFATLGTRAVGVESRFTIILADKTVVMRGWCVVFDAWTDKDNPFGRPGLRLGLHRMTPASQAVFEQIQAARTAAIASGKRLPTVMGMPPLRPPSRASRPRTISIPILEKPRRDTLPLAPITVAPAAKKRPSRAPTPVLAEGSHMTRTPGSAFVLPANPLTDLSDAFLGGLIDDLTGSRPAPDDDVAVIIDRPPSATPEPVVRAPRLLLLATAALAGSFAITFALGTCVKLFAS